MYSDRVGAWVGSTNNAGVSSAEHTLGCGMQPTFVLSDQVNASFIHSFYNVELVLFISSPEIQLLPTNLAFCWLHLPPRVIFVAFPSSWFCSRFQFQAVMLMTATN